jgi:cytochrome c553
MKERIVMPKILFLTLLLSSLLCSNGASSYAKCAECHGSVGDKRALGKSAIIQGQKASKTYEQLKMYAMGERNQYGYGSLMKMQLISLSDNDIRALATYIAILK